MARKPNAKDAVSENLPERTPEFKAFEDLAKLVLSVPKTEIDRREAEHRLAKGK